MARLKARATVTIDPALWAKVDRAARAMGKSRSAWVEAALREVLEGSEDILRVMADRKVRTAMLEALAKPGVVRAIAAAMQGDLDEAKVQDVLAFMKDGGKRDK